MIEEKVLENLKAIKDCLTALAEEFHIDLLSFLSGYDLKNLKKIEKDQKL